jgi:hypothetical protein
MEEAKGTGNRILVYPVRMNKLVFVVTPGNIWLEQMMSPEDSSKWDWNRIGS